MSNLPEYPNDDYMISSINALHYESGRSFFDAAVQHTGRLLDPNNQLDVALHMDYTNIAVAKLLPYLRFEARPPHRGTRTPMEVAKHVVKTYGDAINKESIKDFAAKTQGESVRAD